MARNRTPRFMNLFSPERRSSRTNRWRKRFPKFTLSSWQSSRIIQSVCSAFRAGAEASRVVRWATGSQVVSAGGSKSLRIEGLEERRVLDSSLWNLAASDYSQNWTDSAQITTNDNWALIKSIVGFRGDGLAGGPGVDPQTITAAHSGTAVLDVNANRTDPNTFTTGGVTEFQTTILFDNFDSYEDQATFEAAWPAIGATGDTAKKSAQLSTTLSSSAPKSVFVPVSTTATSTLTEYRNRASFTESGAVAVGEQLVWSFDFYDSINGGNPQRNYANLQDTTAPGATNQLISIGLNNNQGGSDSGGQYYMARILGHAQTTVDPDGGPNEAAGGTASGAYFKLNDFGGPHRSQGWHNFKVIISTDDGLSTDYEFYVDNILVERVSNVGTATTIRSYDNITIGSGLTNGGVSANFDNMNLERLPASVADSTIALQGSGTAEAPSVNVYVKSTGRDNVRISYTLRDLDGSADDAVQPVALQYRINGGGSSASSVPWINVPQGFVADASQGPNLAGGETHVSVSLPEWSNQADLQFRIITADATGNDEWIGVDNITVTSNNAPVFTAPTFTFNVDENTPNGASAGTATATDSGPYSTLTYSIESGNENGAFAINPATGEITVADASQLNYELLAGQGYAYNLQIKATDNGSPALSATASVTVNVADVNEQPSVQDATFFLPEFAPGSTTALGTLVGTLLFNDGDNSTQSPSFSITSGNTDGAFAVDNSGNITVANPAALDLETTPSFTLTVEINDNGTPALTDSATVIINLLNVNEAPTAEANGPYLITVGDDLTLVATGSGDPDASSGDAITEYRWDLDGDNVDDVATTSPVTVVPASLLPATLTPSGSPYTVRLTVVDGGGLFGVDTTTLDVNSPPVAHAGGPYSIVEGGLLTLDGSSSFEADTAAGDTITSYSWNINGHAGAATGVSPTLDWGQLIGLGVADNGTFAITLTVTDSRGGSSTSAPVSLTVNETAPTLELSGDLAAAEDYTEEGALYTLTLKSSDPGDDTVASWSIDWNDGSPIEVVLAGPRTFDASSNTWKTTVSATHTYADGEAYPTIQATATDEDGVYLDTLAIEVENVAPTIEVSGPTNVTVGQVYTLTLEPVVDPGEDTVTEITILWGDGDQTVIMGSAATDLAENGGAIQHTYLTDGDYTISVNLLDEDVLAINAGQLSVSVDPIDTVNIPGTAGDDTLVIDFASGTYSLNGGAALPLTNLTTINFDGGDGNDEIVLQGSQGTVVYEYDTPSDGSVTVDGLTINYTGLEPIVNTGTATDVEFILPGGADSATLTDLGGGMYRLSGMTFEDTDFVLPSGSLTIRGGGGADTLNVASAASVPAITLDFETLNLAADLTGTLAGGANTSNVNVQSSSVQLSDAMALVAASGTVAVSAAGTYTGDLVINKALTLLSAVGPSAIIQGVATGFGGAVRVTANGVTIGGPAQGFTINGAGESALYVVNGVNNLLVEDNTLVGANGKLAVLTEGGVSDLTFQGNTFDSAGTASQLVYVNGQASVGLPSTNVSFNLNFFNGDASGPLLGLESTNGNVTGNQFNGSTPYTQLELWGAGNNVAANVFSGLGGGAYILDPLNQYNNSTLLANNTFAAGTVTIERAGQFVEGVFASIGAAVAAADPGDTIHVGAGTFDEDLLLNKAGLKLIGAGPGVTTIRGVIGGSVTTVQIAANNVEVAGLTITRIGNNTSDWNNPGLNSAGVAIQGGVTGAEIHDNLIIGNRTGIDVNNSSGHTVRNNRIVDNRTGMIFRNQTDNMTVVENDIADNWTVGILFLDASGGTNVPIQSAANSTFSNNNISGNWYGGIVDRQAGGALPAPGTTNLKNFSGNWFGTATPSISTANSAEPGYAALIPVAFGGTATNPGGAPDVLGPASANFDISPYLLSGVDADSMEYGFQGDFSLLQVTTVGAQTGAASRIDEAVSLAAASGTIRIQSGAYAGDVDATQLGESVTLAPGGSPGQVTINGNLTLDGDDALAMEIDGTTAGSLYDQIVVTGTATLGGASLNLSGAYSPMVGDTFTIIDASAISGTFGNGPFDLNSVPLNISYSGGDVVLSVSQPSGVWVDDDWVVLVDNGVIGALDYGDVVESDADDNDDAVTGLVFGYNAFSSISGAVGAVAVGGQVNVLAGTFTESVTINKNLTILGQDSGEASLGSVLNGGPLATPLTVASGAEVVVDGLHIAGGIFGVDVDAADVTIRNSIIAGGSAVGILVDNGSTLTLEDSLLTGAGLGSGVAVVSGSADIRGSVINGRTDGVVVSAGGAATLFNNDLSATFGNKAIQANPLAGVVDASGNWWGATSESGVQSKVLGTVDFTPYLNSGANSATGVGFDGDFSHLHVTALGAQSGSTGRIQEGVNLVDAGGIVQVHAGTYTELVTVNKTVSLRGEQYGVDARTRAAVPETIVNGSGGSFTLQANDIELDGFSVQGTTGLPLGTAIHSNSGFSGYRIANNIIQDNTIGLYLGSSGATTTVVEQNLIRDNDNPGAAGGTGIYSDQGLSNVLIQDNKFAGNNFTAGMNLIGFLSPVTGATISGNEFADGNQLVLFNIDGGLVDDNDFTGTALTGTAIFVGGGSDNLTVSNNTITNRAGSGISFTDAGFGPNSNATITGNTITQDVSLLSSGSPTTRSMISVSQTSGVSTVDNNAITLTGATFGPNISAVRGIVIGGAATGTVNVENNTLDGGGVGTVGVLAQSSLSGAVALEGNAITNVNTSVLIQSSGVATLIGNTLINSGAMAGIGIGVDVAAGSVVIIDGSATENEIAGFGSGVRSAGTVSVTGNDASIHGNAVGIDVTGGVATISGNHVYDNGIGVRFTTGGGGSIDNTNFDGGVDPDNATDLVITSTAGAVTIGSNNQFAGDTFFIDNQSTQSYDLSSNGTTFDESNNFRIEDKIHHRMDTDLPLSTGLLTWVANNVYVTTPGVGSTDSSIQRGVDAAPVGGTVNVESGTYVQNSQLLIDSDIEIKGETLAKPVITPGQNFTGGSAGDAWILVDEGVTFDLNNVVLDGDGFFVWQALRSHGTTTVDNVDFRDIKGSVSGSPYRGVAIQSFGGTVSGGAGSDSHGSGAGASHLIVTNSTFEDIGRIGVLVKGTGATALIQGNEYTGKGAGDWLDYGIEVGAGAKVDVVDNTITGNLGVASDGSTSAGLLITTFFGAGSEVHLSGANDFSGNTVGVHIGFDAADASTVTIAGGSFTGNTDSGIEAGGSGVKLKVAGADLTGNQVGIRVSDGAVVDAGSDNAIDGDPTGLGNSAGGNILTGYTGVSGNYAIEDLNLAAQSDVYARFNDFGPYVDVSTIENYVFDDTDDPTRSMVIFAGALNQQAAPNVVYVDDDWAGTALGADADGAGNTVPNWTGIGGNANGSQFGVDQFATIQDAINAVAAGGSIYVYAGSYVQELVIGKTASLYGFQAGQDARATRTGGESIIEASAASDALIEVSAAGVTIDGFSVDGGDLAFRAIRVNGVDNVAVENNIITAAVRGVQYNGAAAGNTGGVVSQNLIEDLTTGGPESYGVLAFDASYVSVTDNEITADVGVFEQYFYQPNGVGNSPNVISGNVINASLVGYGTNERAAGAATTQLSGNTYNMSGGTGVQLYNIYKTGGIELSGETITGADVGVYAFVSGGSVAITGGSITGADAAGSVGVHVTNYLTDFAYAATGNGDVTIDGVDISDFETGVHVEDDALGAFAVHATITNDTDITSSGTAILVSGADASVDVTNNDNSISGNAVGIDVNGGSANVTNNHIFDNGIGVQFRNGGTGTVANNNFDDGAADPSADNDTDVLVQSSAGVVTIGDGNNFAGDNYYIENLSSQDFDLSGHGAATYEGSLPGSFPDNFRIEDKMFHGPDNGTSGVISWVADTLFVTANGTGANNETIQNAINVAEPDDTIFIEQGSYNANLSISKDINIVGVGNVTLGPAVSGNVITINGSGFGDDETVSITNIDFNGSAGLAGYGIRVSNTASFANLTVDDSSFTGFGFNAIAVFGNATTGISVQDVDITDSTFVDNGIAGGGGSGDLQFFEYNGDATLTNLDLSNTGAGNDAHLGIQFRGVGAQNGTGVLPMGNIALTDIDISGLYVRQLIGLQRYDNASIAFSDVRLGGVGSALTGTFGAALRIDAVGDGSFAMPSTIDLGDTYFRGVGGLGLDIEIAPDGFGFLRADATNTRWDTTSSTAATPGSLPLAEQFEIEDRILHYVDVEHPNPSFGTFDGFVETVDGNAFITTTQLGNIQRGVNAVDLGGTVNVAAGSYAQTTVINKNVELRGAGADVDPELRDLGNLPAETTVSVTGASDVAFLVAPGVTDATINGFNITGNDAALNGIAGHGHSGLNVLNNFVHDFVGIAVALETGVSDALVQYNDIFGSYDGVYLSTGASDITVRDNFIHDSYSAEGEVTLEGDNQNVTIRNNTFSGSTAAGVYVFGAFGSNFAGTAIFDNAFLGATGVNNTNSATLNAAGNWWGAVHGPTSASNPWTGVQPTGAAIIGNVTFTPWLTDGTDTAPNTSGFQPNAGDVVAPAGTAPDLATASDTGNPTDNVTSDNTPTLEGSAEANSLVQIGVWVDTALNPGVVDDSEVTLVALEEADGLGAWTTTLGTLADGTYQFVARVVDQAGNESGWSAPLAVTIDSAISPATTIDLPAAFDSTSPNTSPVGTNSDNITNINTPTLTGAAEPGSTVQLFDGMTLVGTTVADGSGMWSIALGVLADGVHTFTAVATDLANNVSSSAPLAVTIDTIGQPSSIPDMTSATDQGVSNSDNVTNDNTPTFTGTAEAGAYVELLLNDTTVLASGIATGGTWTLTSGLAIPNGSHNIKARVTDIAGNVSTSAALSPVIIDTVPPLANGGPDVIVGEGDSVTLTGTASDAGSGVGSTLWQFVSSTNGQVVPDSPGTLTFTPNSPGQYTFNYVVTDVAGNVSVDTVIVGATFTADFDFDGDVDGDDLGNWQGGFGSQPSATPGQGDEDRDGDVDGNDFLNWQRQVGSTTAVPAVPATLTSLSASSEAATTAALESAEDSSDALASPLAVQSGWWLEAPASSLDSDSDRDEAGHNYDAAFDVWSSPQGVAATQLQAAAVTAGGGDSFELAGDDASDEGFDAFESELDEALAAWADG
jgi:nitrous oxidase accessory protein NosD